MKLKKAPRNERDRIEKEAIRAIKNNDTAEFSLKLKQLLALKKKSNRDTR